MSKQHSNHLSTESSHEIPEGRKKYVKLTPEVKDRFLRRIIFENMSIKEASEVENINYSSAKAIASEHKKSKFSHSKKVARKNSKFCIYANLETQSECESKMTLCSSIGGLMISERKVPRVKIIQKPVHI